MTTSKQAARAALERRVEEWNRTVPVGTEVTVVRDNGAVLKTTTRSEAGIYDNGNAMIMVVGISGAYLLDRVRPVRPASARARGADLDKLAEQAEVDIEKTTRSDGGLAEIRINVRVGFSAGHPLLILRAYDVDRDVGDPALAAAAAAALEVLAEHGP